MAARCSLSTVSFATRTDSVSTHTKPKKNRLWNYEHPVLRQRILAINSSQHYETLFFDVLNGALDTKGMFMESDAMFYTLLAIGRRFSCRRPLKLQGLRSRQSCRIYVRASLLSTATTSMGGEGGLHAIENWPLDTADLPVYFFW